MEVFNIVSGICSIVGLLVSLFTASKVIKISNTYHCGNNDEHTRVNTKISKSKVNGSVVGRDNK